MDEVVLDCFDIYCYFKKDVEFVFHAEVVFGELVALLLVENQLLVEAFLVIWGILCR